MESRSSYNTLSAIKLNILMTCMVFLGAFNPIIIKLQGMVKINDHGDTFRHPYF